MLIQLYYFIHYSNSSLKKRQFAYFSVLLSICFIFLLHLFKLFSFLLLPFFIVLHQLVTFSFYSLKALMILNFFLFQHQRIPIQLTFLNKTNQFLILYIFLVIQLAFKNRLCLCQLDHHLFQNLLPTHLIEESYFFNN